MLRKCRLFRASPHQLNGWHQVLFLINSGVNTSCANGIVGDEEDKKERIAFYGDNIKPVNEPPGFFQLLWDALQDFILKVLMVSALVLIVLESNILNNEAAIASDEKRPRAWVEGGAILLAVFISAIVQATTDYQKERQFQELNEVADSRKKVSVKRNGELLEIHQDDVLVGDVVALSEGMEIPADGILIQANEITTDESAMTGETNPIKKNTIFGCVEKMEEIVESG